MKPPVKANGRKNHTLHKDSLFVLKQGEHSHVISEDYSYKTDSYYTILRIEMEGKRVKPSSSAVIDAFVVPICLERAKIAGIPVCEWEISQAYVPLPAILYGINYFASASEFVTVYDNEAAKEAVRHITNKVSSVLVGCTPFPTRSRISPYHHPPEIFIRPSFSRAMKSLRSR